MMESKALFTEGLTLEQEDIIRTVDSLLENLRNELIEALLSRHNFNPVRLNGCLTLLESLKTSFDLSKPKKGE